MWFLFCKFKTPFGQGFLSLQKSVDLFSHQRDLAEWNRQKIKTVRSMQPLMGGRCSDDCWLKIRPPIALANVQLDVES